MVPPGAEPGCDASTGASVSAEPSAAFTRGPWYIDEAGICSAEVMVAQTCRADQFWGTADEDLPEAEQNRILANARLIAAAPDLLACCQVAVASLKSVARQHNLTGTGAAIIDHIEGVIAKALGPAAQDTSEQSDRTRDESQ